MIPTICNYKSCAFAGVLRLDANEGIFIFYQLVSSPCGYRSSWTAFLFSLVNKPGCPPVTFRPTGPGDYGSYEYAIYSCSSAGPIFGSGNDIYIASEASSNTYSRSHLGRTYNAPSGHKLGSEFAESFLAGSLYFQPDEIEVFYEINCK